MARRRITLHIEEALLAVFFYALVVLGLLGDTDIFEPLAHSRLTWLTLWALPAVLLAALLLRRKERVLRAFRDWWQIVCALAVYESMKHLHANRITEWLGILPKDRLMIRIDEALFGRVLPLWFDAWVPPLLTQVMWFFYVWVYYLGPVLALGYAYFWLQDDALFLRLRKGLVLGLLGGYISYLLIPVAGPLFYVGDRFTTVSQSQPVLRRLVFDTLRYNWDCFPSLHTAIPWTLTFVSWYRLGRLGRVIAVTCACGVTLSTIILRFHYGIDVIAGVMWAVLVAQAQRLAAVREPWVLRA